MSIVTDYVPPLIGLGATGAATYYRYQILAVAHVIRGGYRWSRWYLQYFTEGRFITNYDYDVSQQTRERQAHPGYLWGGDNSVATMNARVETKRELWSHELTLHEKRKPQGQSWDEFYAADLTGYPAKPQAVIDWERQHKMIFRPWMDDNDPLR